MTASMITSLLIVIASVGVMTLFVCLLPAPRIARTGMAVLTILAGCLWGVDQVRVAYPSAESQVGMIRLHAQM